MSVRKSLRRSASQNQRSVCLTSIRLFWNSVSAIVRWKKNDSGVRFTTMGHGSDVFDRGCVVAHEGYVGLEAAWAHVRTGLAAAKSIVCDYAQDACVVSLMSPHACCSV